MQLKVEQQTQRNTFSHYLLTVMPMESQVKVLSPRNVSGASQQTFFFFSSVV